LSKDEGVDERSRTQMNAAFLLATAGGAGAPHADAWQTICHVGNGGLCYYDSIELDELRHPLYVHARHFSADTEGAGRHCGARAAYCEYGPARGDMDVVFVSDGTTNAARGVRGGIDGVRATQFKVTRNGAREDLPNCAVVRLATGERIAATTTGGGGYGPPRERDPDAVRHDVAEGYVGAERAREVYGVVIDATGTVDRAATAALRAGGQR